MGDAKFATKDDGRTSAEPDVVVSFLGTTDYREAQYRFGDGTVVETRFVQSALAVRYPAAERIIIATPEAKKIHQAALRNEADRNGLRQPKFIETTADLDDSVTWQLLADLGESIADGAAAVFDITNGFRAQPMMAMAAIQYLRALNRVTVVDVVYGAFARNDDDGAVTTTPIVSIASIVEAGDWAIAARTLLDFGHVGPLVGQTRRPYPASVPKAVSVQVNALSRLDRVLGLARYGELKRATDAVSGSRKALRRADHHAGRALELLVDRVVDATVGSLEQPNGAGDWAIWVETIALLGRQARLAQALMLAQELAVTGVVVRSGRDPLNRSDRLVATRRLHRLTDRSLDDADEAERDLYRLWAETLDYRNDIAHASFRPTPKLASDMGEKVPKLIDRYCDYLRQADSWTRPLWDEPRPSATELLGQDGSARLVNLTPHPVVLITENGSVTLPADGRVPRVTTEDADIGTVPVGLTASVGMPDPLVPVVEVRHGEVQGLPDSEDGVVYIVARIVADAARSRRDLVFPDGLVRDADGAVIAASRLGRIAP